MQKNGVFEKGLVLFGKELVLEERGLPNSRFLQGAQTFGLNKGIG